MTDAGMPAGDRVSRRIWEELERATTGREHGWRTPVLATVDAGGAPAARTVILRQVETGRQRLGFYTDERSNKVSELRRTRRATLVFWDSALRWQLRVSGESVIESRGPAVDAVWANLAGTAAASDYLSPAAPGSPLANTRSGESPESHLAIVWLTAMSIDWLELNDSGHRRAMISGNSVEWLVP